MTIHYFKFAFPGDCKAFPKKWPLQYEVIGNVGLITTENDPLSIALETLQMKRVGSIQKIRFDLVQELIGNRKVIDQIEPIPSFTKQTKWPCGFFELPEQPGTHFFNPGLEWWNGLLHLFARRCQISHNEWYGTHEDNDLAIFKLNPDLSIKSGVIPEPPKRYNREQWEDPRVFVANGNCYVSMATLVRGISWKIRQCLCVMSPDLSKFEVVSEPHFGGNHSSPALATGHEKNWTWFAIEKLLYCVYSLHPLTIFVPNYFDGSLTRRVDSKVSEFIPWQHGALRGGTNPELHDGQYWVFFHSSIPWKDAFGHSMHGTRRRYYMGALTFTSTPPFRLTSITPKPLLIGSEEDPHTLEGPPVVFPCGAKLVNDSWLVTMGINDERCGWISIPSKELKALMVPII